MSSTLQFPVLGRTSRGLAAYVESLRIYEIKMENHNMINDVLRYLNFDQEEDDEFLSEYTEYDDDNGEEEIWWDDNITLEYKLVEMSPAELQNSMEHDCPMCLEEMKRVDCVTTSCKHSFCVTCYEKYKKSTCPCCRRVVMSLTTYKEK